MAEAYPELNLPRVTTLACWIAVDSRRPSAAYIATDSRISWSASKAWDHGLKTFASSGSPDVFGYVGDVLFPALVLAQFSQAASAGLFTKRDFGSRTGALLRLIKTSWDSLPAEERRDFTIVHCGRDGAFMGSVFGVALIRRTKRGFATEQLEIPKKSSSFILTAGSGGAVVVAHSARWETTTAENTSRANFWALRDTIAGGTDPLSGGTPQLVGLYRMGNGRIFGHIDDKKQRFVAGMPVDFAPMGDMEWRNEDFERMDARTRRRLKKAQKQARPARLQARP